jgi:predicted patatin/cPLA2 family phospholipase
MGSSDKPALVLEGGGYRGIFTAGVLDVLLENGIYTGSFKSVWGVSAGALNAVSYRSRQIGRTMRIMLTFRDDPRMMSLLSLVRTGNLAGTDFMYDEVQNHIDPCDLDVFDKDLTPMYFVASDVLFGAPAYLHVEGEKLDATKARASASLPGVSTMVEIDGHRYLDGGTTDSIPFAVAMGLDGAPEVPGAEPADRALVVLTQDRTYIKDGATERAILRTHRYDAYPYYEQALATRADRYNAQREELAGLETEGRALVLRPPEPVKIRTSEHNGEPLLRLYLQGRQEAMSHLSEIRAFL